MKYKVQFVNPSYRRFFHAHKEEIMNAFYDCASKGDFMLRKQTREFERNLADYIGTRFAIGVNSGTDAMFLSLKALGIGKGDEVITVSHTFIATLQAIVHTGATPILVDVNENDELMNMVEVERAITHKTKAILPVHFHGKICDMSSLQNVIPDFMMIYIIEDVAQALGAIRNEKKVGSFGTMGCFSFNFPKLMGAYGDAGGITTSNEEVYKRLLLLRNHWNITQGSVDQDKYPQPEEMEWGWKSRIDNIQAAILNVKFKYLDGLLKRRWEIGQYYNRELKSLLMKLPNYKEGEVVQEYNVKVKDNMDFKRFLEREGVEVLVRDTTPNHKLKGLGLEHWHLPITEKLARGSVRLPCYPELFDSEIEEVIRAIKKYYA